MDRQRGRIIVSVAVRFVEDVSVHLYPLKRVSDEEIYDTVVKWEEKKFTPDVHKYELIIRQKVSACIKQADELLAKMKHIRVGDVHMDRERLRRKLHVCQGMGNLPRPIAERFKAIHQRMLTAQNAVGELREIFKIEADLMSTWVGIMVRLGCTTTKEVFALNDEPMGLMQRLVERRMLNHRSAQIQVAAERIGASSAKIKRFKDERLE